MNESFEILDGKLFIEKNLFYESQHSNNNILALTGSNNEQMFKSSPSIRTGIESVIIDYHDAVNITIPRNPQEFVEELNNNYHSKCRGSLKIYDHRRIYDLLINKY